MLQELKALLKQVKKEKTEAMKPYNERIRAVKGAIRNLDKFETVSLDMNTAPERIVAELPKPEQTEE